VYEVLGRETARGAEVAQAARLAASTVSAALRALAEHGLAERGLGGWCRGPACLDDVAESTGAAELHRDRAERYKQDREGWRARLRHYQGARQRPAVTSDGWLSLEDEDEDEDEDDWAAMLLSRWPVLGEDFVRGPPSDGTVPNPGLQARPTSGPCP
jgi:hypothetical protein